MDQKTVKVAKEENEKAVPRFPLPFDEPTPAPAEIEKPEPETDEESLPVFCFEIRPSGIIAIQTFGSEGEGLERLKKAGKKGKFFFVELHVL